MPKTMTRGFCLICYNLDITNSEGKIGYCRAMDIYKEVPFHSCARSDFRPISPENWGPRLDWLTNYAETIVDRGLILKKFIEENLAFQSPLLTETDT